MSDCAPSTTSRRSGVVPPDVVGRGGGRRPLRCVPGVARASRKEAVESGTGRVGTASLVSLAGRSDGGGGLARKGSGGVRRSGGGGGGGGEVAARRGRVAVAAAERGAAAAAARSEQGTVEEGNNSDTLVHRAMREGYSGDTYPLKSKFSDRFKPLASSCKEL
uniref:Uncharacterized protein n=1 Tax=Oryza sativa subsp. japonica TaxID=39947 RepID=Q653T4_ORYSJ|nr:hypothetical protein [Oryza sativa Japonica Group]BAD45933.1 hypothetical protein [Oryza sativa Japonica Group]